MWSDAVGRSATAKHADEAVACPGIRKGGPKI